MFLIRNVTMADYKDLVSLGQELNTVNLPSHPADIRKMIRRAVESFRGRYQNNKARAQYLFVMEDTRTGRVIGTSKIFAQHGTPEKPHLYFAVRYEKVASKTLSVQFRRKVYRLKTDTRGFTEIGGLVLNPRYRDRPEKLGKQLSYMRFVYMKAHPSYFKPRVIAELLPPLHDKKESTLWNFYGYKLTHIPYQQADRLSYKNKEFILKLFPKADLYHDILPPAVQADMEQTGLGSAAAKKILTRIGFRYAHQVDPFDGGPNYIAKRSKIQTYRQTRKMRFGGVKKLANGPLKFVMTEYHGQIRALLTPARINRGQIYLPPRIHRILTPFDENSVFIYNWT